MTWNPQSRGDRLAQWAAQLRWNDLDSAVQEKAKLHVLDTFGTMCSALESPYGLAVERAMREDTASEGSTVVGRSWCLPAPSAAFVNAFHARTHAFDDTAQTMHPGSAIISAALALAEKTRASGATFLTAVVAGYEVATRVSASVTPAHYDSGFHNTGTCNTFGACAAGGRLLEFDAQMMAEAFGLAGESASGLRQYQDGGTMADSALDGARAAHAGLMAARLRAAGLPGTLGILDGPWGFCRVLCSDPNLDEIDRQLGVRFAFMATVLKPFPTAIFTHVPIDTLIRLRNDHRIDPDNIDAVVIKTFKRSFEVGNLPDAGSPLVALLSHQYCAALALAKGSVELADFQDHAVANPVIQRLAASVQVVHDASFDKAYPKLWTCEVEVTLRDGTSYHVRAETAPSALERPIDFDFVESKFRALAEPVLGAKRSRALVSAVMRLPELEDISELRPLLQAN